MGNLEPSGGEVGGRAPRVDPAATGSVVTMNQDAAVVGCVREVHDHSLYQARPPLHARPREVIKPDHDRRSVFPSAAIATHPLFESDVRPSKSNDKPFMCRWMMSRSQGVAPG